MNYQLYKTAVQVHSIGGFSSLIKSIRFVIFTARNSVLLENLQRKITSINYEHILNGESSVLAVVERPYIHKEWDVGFRIETIFQHYEALQFLPTFLDVSQGNVNEMVDLTEFSPNAKLVLDRAPWFKREGEATANLFKDGLRVMSITFSLGRFDNELVIYVGGIQGVHAGVSSADSLSIIKGLTKDLHGVRPKSLMVEVLRLLSLKLGVKKILAVSDENRHHRHLYFSSLLDKLPTCNYDGIWLEHEGVPVDGGFFMLPLEANRKGIGDVASKKRSMYRKRYVMLDKIKQDILAL